MGKLVLAILIVYIIWMAERGYQRGFIRTIFSIAVVLVSVLCATIFGPMAGKWMIENETIYGVVEKQVDQVIGEQLENNSKELNHMITQKNVTELMGQDKQLEKQWEQALEQVGIWVEELPVPKKMKQEIKKEIDKVQDGQWKERTIQEMVVGSITESILQTVGYILVFAVVSVLMKILFGILVGMTSLPILHHVNKLAGLAAGFVQGVCIIWIAGVCIYMISSTSAGQSIINVIYSNSVLTWIYENNIFL